MRDKYCLPIMRAAKAEVLDAVDTYEAKYAYFEVWLDYILDLDEGFVRELVARLGRRLVVVFRRQVLEPMKMEQDRRLALLRLFDGTPVLVDLDLASQEAELMCIRREGLGVQVIASYHNYDETPAVQELREITRRMDAYAPAVYKVAAMCAREADAVRLLELLLELRADGKRCIVLGMGAPGVVTRIFGTLWGNELVFVPETAAGASAPGQLAREQFEAMAKVLEG